MGAYRRDGRTQGAGTKQESLEHERLQRAADQLSEVEAERLRRG